MSTKKTKTYALDLYVSDSKCIFLSFQELFSFLKMAFVNFTIQDIEGKKIHDTECCGLLCKLLYFQMICAEKFLQPNC